MGNTAYGGLNEVAHSVVVLVNFLGCGCGISLLRGDRREELLGLLRKAVERSGFGVLDGDIQPFGKTMQERNEHGATLNLILEDSGVSFDCYPEVATVQMNLHYCNITNNNDSKVDGCIENIKAILRPLKTKRKDPIVMYIYLEAEERVEAAAMYAQLPNR